MDKYEIILTKVALRIGTPLRRSFYQFHHHTLSPIFRICKPLLDLHIQSPLQQVGLQCLKKNNLKSIKFSLICGLNFHMQNLVQQIDIFKHLNPEYPFINICSKIVKNIFLRTKPYFPPQFCIDIIYLILVFKKYKRSDLNKARIVHEELVF